MMNSERSLLLLIFSLTWFIVLSSTLANGATCESSCRSVAAIQDQAFWNHEMYHFLVDCSKEPYVVSESCDLCKNSSNKTSGNKDSVYNETMHKQSVDFWMDHGNRLLKAGSYREAQVSFSNAIKLDPTILKGWLGMGDSLCFLGRYQDSLDAYNAALKLSPLNATALQGKMIALQFLDHAVETKAVKAIPNASS